jgi:hypothetical protein
MQVNSQVIQFRARPPKATRKPWIGPIEAERERCIEALGAPECHGHWRSAAARFLRTTDMPAGEIIDAVKAIRAEVAAEIQADIAAGLYNTIPKS